MEREGLTAEADTAQVEVLLTQAGAQWLLTRRAVEESHLTLAQTLAVPPGLAFTIEDQLPNLPAPPMPEEIAALEENALLVRPELRSQDLERRIAANTVRREISNFFPHLDLSASYNWTSEATAVNPAFGLLGWTLTHSLLDGGRQVFSYQKARRGTTLEEQRTILLSLGILYEVDSRMPQVFRGYDTLLSEQRIVAAQAKVFKLVFSRYENGLETSAETVAELARLHVARLELDRARTAYLCAWYELRAAALPHVKPDGPAKAQEQGAAPVKPPPSAPPLPAFTPPSTLDAVRALERLPAPEGKDWLREP